MQLQIERGNSMKLDEDKLSTAIKSREISRVNYLYGEERFLVKTYTDRLLDATVGKDRNDINLIKLAGTFPVDTLTDSIDSMPLFADSKAVLISDLDLEKFDDSGIETILNSLKDVPDECKEQKTHNRPHKAEKCRSLRICPSYDGKSDGAYYEKSGETWLCNITG